MTPPHAVGTTQRRPEWTTSLLACVVSAVLGVGCAACGGQRSEGVHVTPPITRPVAEPNPASEPAPSVHAIHVAQSGDDARDGLTPEHAVASIAHALELVVDGRGDQVLLRRGDVFELDEPLVVDVSGASESAPFVLGVFGEGDARATLRSSGVYALALVPRDPARGLAHVRVEGIALEETRSVEAIGEDVSEGIHLVAPDGASSTATDVTLEDVSIRGFGVGVNALGTNTASGIRDLTLRHVLVLDTRHARNAIAMLFSRVHGLLLEEVVVDGVQRSAARTPSVFDHSVYVQTDCEDVIVRGSIFARAPDGVMQRAGGVLEDNLIVDVAIGALEGYVFGGAVPTPGGVTFRVERNVIMDLGDLSPELGRGNGLYVGNTRSGVVRENLIARSRAANAWSSWAIALMGETNEGNVGVHDLAVSGNVIVDVPTFVRVAGTAVDGVRFEDNTIVLRDGPVPAFSLDRDVPLSFGANRGLAALANARVQIGREERALPAWLASRGAPPLGTAPSPALRDAAAYHASIGGEASLEAFLAAVRAQSGNRWRPELTGRDASAWIRGGATAR